MSSVRRVFSGYLMAPRDDRAAGPWTTHTWSSKDVRHSHPYLSVYLFTYLPTYLPIYVSIYLSISIYHLPIYLDLSYLALHFVIRSEATFCPPT